MKFYLPLGSLITQVRSPTTTVTAKRPTMADVYRSIAHCSRYLSVCDIMTSDIRNPEVFFTIAWVTLLQSHRCWVACTFCDSIIEGDSLCANEMCPSRHLIDGVSEGFQTRATRLSVTTTIADHTTSLPGVKLFGDAAVTMLDLKSVRTASKQSQASWQFEH
jgi:hypothetical protein